MNLPLLAKSARLTLLVGLMLGISHGTLFAQNQLAKQWVAVIDLYGNHLHQQLFLSLQDGKL